MVPFPPCTGVSVPRQQPCRTCTSITSASRLEFLWGTLSHNFSMKVVDMILRVHRPSSVRQYESCWRRFGDNLRSHALGILSINTILNVPTWLADSTNRAPATISAHYAALTDPLHFDVGIRVSQRALSLLREGINSKRAETSTGPGLVLKSSSTVPGFRWSHYEGITLP